MVRSIVYLALVLFASETFAASAFQSRPHRGRDESSSPRTIRTKILSANGTDLTSSFQTMIYFQPNATNLAGLSDRQVSFSRPINTCQSPNTTFDRSHCIYTFHPFSASLIPLQQYVVFCHQSAPIRTVRREMGACAQGEICIDGTGANKVAHCVSEDYFMRVIQRQEEQLSTEIAELEGKTAQMVISLPDGSTPLPAQGIDLQAGFVGNADEGKPVLQERKCRHCFELRTQKMAEGTNFLQVEASLMTAATVAAGVVWLIISG